MTDKRKYKPPRCVQAFYYLIILIAVGFLVWEKSKPDEQVRLWFLIFWFVVMITAYFRATRNWAHDNPKPSVEELLEEEKMKENTKETEIKDVDIPDLNQMVKNLKKKKNHG